MEWVELLKLTGPAGAVLLVLILAPWIVFGYVGKWLLARWDTDLESRIKLANALEALTQAIRDK
jgi:hypothetical protein